MENNINRKRINWLNQVLDSNGRNAGTLVCGPNRDGTYVLRMHASGSLLTVKGQEIEIQLSPKGGYVAGESVRSSVFADPSRPCC